MMKFILRCLLAALAISATLASAAQKPAAGLLIYQNVPSTYVEAFEFVSVAKKNLFDSVVIRPNGQSYSCKTEGILAVVNYPSLFISPENAAAALDNIRNIESLQQRYPKFKGQLQVVEAKWTTAVEAGKQMKPKEPVAQNPASKVESYSFTTTTGKKFENVTILGTSGTDISIVSDSGIEHVPFEQLPKDMQTRFHYEAPKVATKGAVPSLTKTGGVPLTQGMAPVPPVDNAQNPIANKKQLELPSRGCFLSKVVFRNKGGKVETKTNQFLYDVNDQPNNNERFIRIIGLDGKDEVVDDLDSRLVSIEWNRQQHFSEKDAGWPFRFSEIIRDNNTSEMDAKISKAAADLPSDFNWEAAGNELLRTITSLNKICTHSTGIIILQKVNANIYEARSALDEETRVATPHFIVKTTKTNFESTGRAYLPLIFVKEIDIPLKNGFTEKLGLYEETVLSSSKEALEKFKRQELLLAAAVKSQNISPDMLKKYIRTLGEKKIENRGRSDIEGSEYIDCSTIEYAIIGEIFKSYSK